jgi:ribosomal protein L37AE/L43A
MTTNSSPDSSPDFHFCTACDEPVHLRRYQLGYRLCLTCGEREARKVTYPSAPINKSNYVLITNRAQLKQLNPKRLGE